MRFEVVDQLSQVDPGAWDALRRENDPFLSHAFLNALEQHQCAAPHFGWTSRHLLGWEGDRLVAALPGYLKQNSYGEFVFDHAWAEAYHRNGLTYYPKLVSSIPYTPATGQRLLHAADFLMEVVLPGIQQAQREFARQQDLSSVHWLFDGDEYLALEGEGWMTRVGVQFHWFNRDYRDFSDFLDALNAKRRKNIRRERRQALAHGLEIRRIDGDQVSAEQWLRFADLYQNTFDQHYSPATLNAGFFQEIGARLGWQVQLVAALRDGEMVAAALLLCSDKVLYGRHWGAFEEFPGLHFELCYYQGIEFAIERGMQRFEPGAQGEHKIWRGFLPSLTWSSHWIEDQRFRAPIADFLQRERRAVLQYKAQLEESHPYRRGGSRVGEKN